jgi:hypothetical protein
MFAIKLSFCIFRIVILNCYQSVYKYISELNQIKTKVYACHQKLFPIKGLFKILILENLNTRQCRTDDVEVIHIWFKY